MTYACMEPLRAASPFFPWPPWLSGAVYFPRATSTFGSMHGFGPLKHRPTSLTETGNEEERRRGQRQSQTRCPCDLIFSRVLQIKNSSLARSLRFISPPPIAQTSSQASMLTRRTLSKSLESLDRRDPRSQTERLVHSSFLPHFPLTLAVPCSSCL